MRETLLSLLLVFFLVGSAPAEEPVDFADPTLKAAVEDALWVLDPTPTDMLGLTSLTIIGKKITSLSGLEHATNLLSLTLQRNSLSDISPLASLVNLQSLDIEENSVSDISALASMPYLSKANLHRNRITDISTLAGMTSLSWLDLRWNPLSEEAYETHIALIFENNPGIFFAYDPTYLRRLSIGSTTGGRVTHPGEGVFGYVFETELYLTAEPDPGYRFVRWTGNFYSTSHPARIVMHHDFDITAHFERLLDVIYVDNNLSDDPGSGEPTDNGSDASGTAARPFGSIQEAIDLASNGALIVVRPGTYYETIDLLGKSIRITGIDPNGPNVGSYPVIDGAGRGPVISIEPTYFGDPTCEIGGFVITAGRGPVGALSARKCELTIRNCLIVGNHGTGRDESLIHCRNSIVTFENCTVDDYHNRNTGAAIVAVQSDLAVTNSILFGNTPHLILADDDSNVAVCYSNVVGEWPGPGNTDDDPLFVRRGHWATRTEPGVEIAPTHPGAIWIPGDYHLRSQSGRWNEETQTWMLDTVTSPCIDGGDPEMPAGHEPVPNGGTINMGAYGGTAQASKSY